MNSIKMFLVILNINFFLTFRLGDKKLVPCSIVFNTEVIPNSAKPIATSQTTGAPINLTLFDQVVPQLAAVSPIALRTEYGLCYRSHYISLYFFHSFVNFNCSMA
jgi:hypothetical protein